MKGKSFTVVGPAVHKAVPDLGPGPSFATTVANHAALNHFEQTFTVFDPEGVARGHAMSFSDGTVSTYRYPAVAS